MDDAAEGDCTLAAEQLPATPTIAVNIFDSLLSPTAAARWRPSQADTQGKIQILQLQERSKLMEQYG